MCLFAGARMCRCPVIRKPQKHFIPVYGAWASVRGAVLSRFHKFFDPQHGPISILSLELFWKLQQQDKIRVSLGNAFLPASFPIPIRCCACCLFSCFAFIDLRLSEKVHSVAFLHEIQPKLVLFDTSPPARALFP